MMSALGASAAGAGPKALFAKGAPESILERCTAVLTNEGGSVQAMTPGLREALYGKVHGVGHGVAGHGVGGGGGHGVAGMVWRGSTRDQRGSRAGLAVSRHSSHTRTRTPTPTPPGSRVRRRLRAARAGAGLPALAVRRAGRAAAG